MSRPGADDALPRQLALAALGFSAFFVAFFADTMFGRVLGFGDGPGYFRPFYERPRSMWTDSLFGGFPVVGDAQSGFFNPLAIVLGGLGFGFDAFVVAGYVLCAVGGFALGRVLTGRVLPGLASGLAFSMSGFLLGQLDHVAVVHVAGWIALAVAALEAWHRTGAWQAFVALAVSVGCSILAGSFQFTAYGGALLAVLVLVRAFERADRLRFLLTTGLALLCGGLLGAVALSPSFELVGMSVRSALTWENFVSNSYSPGLLPSFVFPRLFLGSQALPGLPDVEASGYVGLAVLVLAVVGLTALPRREAVVWGAIVVVALLFALGPSTPLPHLLFRVPLWNLFRGPSRHFFELSVGAAALCAYGVAAVQNGAVSRRAVTIAGLALVALIGGGLVLGWSTPRVLSVPPTPGLWPWTDWRLGGPALVGLVVVGGLWLGRSLPAAAAVLLVVVTGAELVFVHQAASWRRTTPLDETPPLSTAAAPHLLEATNRGARVLVLKGYWDANVPANSALSLGLSSVSGYSPLEPRTFAELTGIDANGHVFDPGPLISDDNVLLDILSVGVVAIVTGHQLPSPRFEAFAELPGGALVRNTRARPRAWFVTETLRLDGDEARAAVSHSRLPDGRVFDPRTMALVERVEPRTWSPGCSVRQQTRGEGWIEVATSCDEGPGFLVVSERGFPGWRADVDGARVPIVRTDVLISGVEVPRGAHVVTLRYSPSSVWVGLALSVAGALGLAFAARRLGRAAPAQSA